MPGPPFRDFRELDREKMIDGAIGNMVVPIELIQKAIDPMVKNKFGRIVNITSGSVKMPLVGLDLSSGARAGLTAFLAGVARSVAQHNVTINFLLPGPFDTDRLRSNNEITAKKQGITVEQATANRAASVPAKRLGNPDEFGAACAFLCSSHAGFITGQNLLMDGGIFPGRFDAAHASPPSSRPSESGAPRDPLARSGPGSPASRRYALARPGDGGATLPHLTAKA